MQLSPHPFSAQRLIKAGHVPQDWWVTPQRGIVNKTPFIILVSGNLSGRTQTAPLYIFAKFNEGQVEAANAVAIVLAVFSFVIFSILFFARDWLETE